MFDFSANSDARFTIGTPDRIIPSKQHPAPEDILTNPNHLKFLSQSLTILPPRQQEIVRLHYFDQISLPQAAEQLGINRTTAWRRLNAAQATLRELTRFYDGA